ncbi:MAG: CehA/McbA family metallohydrolase [Eubacterium sp.]|nr:CehA/McbA family metallohydrolase [Eubacterium sp.]
MSWLPCELHCHTVHSDGDFLPQALQQAAVDNELAMIALTDHNTFSGAAAMDSAVLPFVQGIEWTTYFGHLLVLGANTFVDWRDAVPDNIDEKISAVRATGALVGVAHPFQLGSPMCTGGRWEFRVQQWEQVNYIEIWHERFTADSYENRNALQLWTSLLDRGYRLAASYGRDWHRPAKGGHFCCTYLDLHGAPSQAKALAAIAGGRTVVSTGARFFFTVTQNGQVYHIGDTVPTGEAVLDFYTDIYARSRFNGAKLVHQTVRVVTNGGETVTEASVSDSRVAVTLAPDHWYRAELYGTFNGEPALLAVTSPVYTEKA